MSLSIALSTLEGDMVRRALEVANGDIPRAAGLLEIDNRRLLRKMAELGLGSGLPDGVLDAPSPHTDFEAVAEALARHMTVSALERSYILAVLDAENGNKKSAAERLGIDRRTLYRKLEEWGQLEGGTREAE
jgi:DNA-binding NtrC family response regulator